MSIFTPGLELTRLGFFSSLVKSSPKCEWAWLRKSKPGLDFTWKNPSLVKPRLGFSEPSPFTLGA